MEIPFNRWYGAISQRVSRRSYDSQNLTPEEMDSFKQFCEDFNPFIGVRALLCVDSLDKVFKGAIGNYGKVKGAQVFVAFIGDTRDPNVNEKIGYFGEGIILEATARGLGTCWVGGYFHPEVVTSLLDIKGNERVYAVSPVGHPVEAFTAEENRMRSFIKAHKRLPLIELVTGLSQEQWPKWAGDTLEGARLAPSAHNNQPWEFRVRQDAITISVNEQRGKLQQFNRLDCGIALLHIQLGAQNAGVNGDFRFLKDPEVAVFNINVLSDGV